VYKARNLYDFQYLITSRKKGTLALAGGFLQIVKRNFPKETVPILFIQKEAFKLLPLDEYELKTMMRQTIIMTTDT